MQLTGSWGLGGPNGIRAREDACMQELVERHPVGLDPLRAHLLRQLLSFVEAARVEMCLEQRVVTHHVQAINPFHILKMPQSAGDVSTSNKRLEQAVVCQEADGATIQLQFLEEGHSAVEIAFYDKPLTMDDTCLSCVV